MASRRRCRAWSIVRAGRGRVRRVHLGQLERRVEGLRRRRKLGPARIAGVLEMNPLDGASGVVSPGPEPPRLDGPAHRATVIRRRIEHDRPGEQVQMDIKKLGRIPPGGGWRAHGRGNVADHTTTMVGYAFIHTAIDSHTRLAYSEVLADEKAVTAIGFWQRAHAWFAELGIHDRGAPDRQRFLLQGASRSPPRSKPPAHDTTGSHPAPAMERQSRTFQPDPARRVGLRPRLPLRDRPHHRT